MPEVRIATGPNGRPDCRVNPDIGTDATTFGFLPSGCYAATDCDRIKALVLALDNVDPIPDGSMLYTCSVDIPAETEPGRYSLGPAEPGASDPSGTALRLIATSGEVVVETPSN